MKKVKFAALNLEAELSNNCFFFDDGYVTNLDEHTKFLKWKHDSNSKMEKKYLAIGHTYTILSQDGKFAYIYYMKQQDSWRDIKVRAHEETHALDFFNGLQYLQNQLNLSGYDLNLHSMDDEMRAMIGGWYSLIAWNQGLQMHGILGQRDKQAFYLLSKSKIRKKHFWNR